MFPKSRKVNELVKQGFIDITLMMQRIQSAEQRLDKIEGKQSENENTES